MNSKIDLWPHPATIEPNRFKYKSLSCWSYNIAVGCEHGCTFCYVPNASTNKLAPKLKDFGVTDPDAEWGQYLLLRQWDEQAFNASLKKAQLTPINHLNADGNRAVMLCTTTDPYQVIRHPEAIRRKALQFHAHNLVRNALEQILYHSTLNVRILTRSPLAHLDFPFMKLFGPRLLFGMSLPTLNNKLAAVYEPHAPAPSARLRCLQQARDEGLHVYVAMAPTYPECDAADLRATLTAIKRLEPVTIFHEPINIRADNVARIEKQADLEGVKLRTEVFADKKTWAQYALDQLMLVENIAADLGLFDRLHLWPDASLGPIFPHIDFRLYWNRISHWPS